MMNLDKFNTNMQDIAVIAYRLATLSDAFYVTGNDRTGAILQSLSDSLLEIQVDLREFSSEAVNTFANTAREGSNNMLAMALTMAGIMREEAENE